MPATVERMSDCNASGSPSVRTRSTASSKGYCRSEKIHFVRRRGGEPGAFHVGGEPMISHCSLSFGPRRINFPIADSPGKSRFANDSLMTHFFGR